MFAVACYWMILSVITVKILLHSLKESNGYKITPHYTALLQLCDVCINKSLRDRSKKCVSNWRREKHALLTSGDSLLTHKRIYVIN